MKRSRKPTPGNNHTEPAAAAAKPMTCSSAAEIRDFLEHVKGKAPEEVLGTASGYGLTVAMIQATVITVVTMVALTVGPYVYSKSAAAKAEPNKTQSPEPDGKAPGPIITAPAPLSTAKTTQPGKDFLDKIGANDTKTANPKVNPLDKSLDDLLDDKKK